MQAPVAGRYVLTRAVFSDAETAGPCAWRNQRSTIVQDTVFAELALRGSASRHTWVGGVAFERATLDPRERPEFAYTYNVPGLFVQDDVQIQRWLIAVGERSRRRSQ